MPLFVTKNEQNNSKGALKMDCSKTINFFAEVKRLCGSRATCDDTAHDGH